MQRWKGRRFVLVFTVLFLLSAPASEAQQHTGNIYGVVMDPDGQPIVGATLTLEGPAAARTQLSTEGGAFRFLRLDPGAYVLRGEVAGFAPIESDRLEIRVGHNLTVELRFRKAMEEIVVTGTRTPLLDERKIEQGTTLTDLQLDIVPTARDPWALLNQAPGILVDRVNVGGNESGQQSVFVAPGSHQGSNNYAIDGVQITDMTIAASSTYFDFGTFEEVRITTGGADVTHVSPGATVNVVTKRGADTPRGSLRFLATDDSLQSSPDIVQSSFGPGQTRIETNVIRSLEETGIELGGPILRDRIWAWGSWARNDINQNAAGGTPDDTLLENRSIKIDAQPTSSTALVGWFYEGDKEKFGRGAGPGRATETTWDQGGDGTTLWKVEASHVLNASLFLTAFYADAVQDFDLVAKGGVGPEAPEAILGPDGVFRDGFQSLFLHYPSGEQFQIEGSWFAKTGALAHEVETGVRSREFVATVDASWPGGRDLVNIAGVNFGLPEGPQDIFFLNRSADSGTIEYESAWIQDTITFDQWTINAGLRWDRQKGSNNPIRVDANPVRPDIFPAIATTGEGAGFVWKDLQPRIGLTWALTDTMLVRASYSRYVDQLIGDPVIRTNPLSFPGPSAFFLFIDADGDNRFGEGEFSQFLFGQAFDVFDPTSSPNRTDPELEAPRTDEIVLQAEGSISSDLMVGASVVHRKIDRILDERMLVRDLAGDGMVRVVSRDDFLPDRVIMGPLPDGKSYSVQTWSLHEGLFSTGGTLLTNGDREQEYLGATIYATKRLSDRWMLQGHLQWSDFEWQIGSGFSETRDRNDLLGSDDNDGDQVAEGGGVGLDSKASVYFNSRWSFSLTGLTQIAPDRRWGFDVSANVSGRDGYPLPYYATVVGQDGISRDIQVTDEVDSFRAEDLFTFDLGLRREIPFTERFLATVDLTVFNLFNEGTVLQRELQLNSPRGDFLNEALSPRIVRFGVRLNWN